MKTIEQMNTIENNYIRQCGGIHNLREGNWKMNTIARNKIRAVKSQYGSCFLGNLNKKENQQILQEYKKGMVYNFGCDFVLSEYNSELVAMIEEYQKKPYSSQTMKDIKYIYAKVSELNGIGLYWI
jgi:hypothetical protein